MIAELVVSLEEGLEGLELWEGAVFFRSFGYKNVIYIITFVASAGSCNTCSLIGSRERNIVRNTVNNCHHEQGMP